MGYPTGDLCLDLKIQGSDVFLFVDAICCVVEFNENKPGLSCGKLNAGIVLVYSHL